MDNLLLLIGAALLVVGAGSYLLGYLVQSRQAWHLGHRQGYQQGVLDRPELEMDDE